MEAALKNFFFDLSGLSLVQNRNPNPNISLILTLKQYSLNKEIDPDLGPGRDPAFYWHPVITFEFP